MADFAAGVLSRMKDAAGGLAKGLYDPTLPLTVKLTPISSIDVPLAHHSVSVIKGRAYLFGGKTVSEAGGLELASNHIHIVILPSSGIESADYKKIEATKDSPSRRHGHSAAVIDDQIYVYGGSGEDDEPIEENGRVWVFDTISNQWSYLDPPEGTPKPDPRSSQASVATEHPRPEGPRQDKDILPQQPPDPETTIPNIPAAGSYGTLLIQGGRAKSGNNLIDTWSFDISTRTWRELPEPPGPSTPSPNLALLGDKLYTLSAGQTSILPLTKGSYNDMHGQGELGIAPLRPWQSLPPSSSSPEKSYPGERTETSMCPVTTGQGRNYLLLAGGKSHSGEVLEDIWTLQLQPEGMTAASFTDATLQLFNKNTGEAEWEEVSYHNADGEMVQEGQLGRGIGPREGFAAAKGTDIDGASMLIWGGIGADGKPRGDGLMVSISA